MYTVAAVNQGQKTLTLAANIISSYELNVGDTINVYNPAAKFLGTATISSFAFTNTAPVTPSTPDIVFGGTFQYYTYYQVSVLLPIAAAEFRSQGTTERQKERVAAGMVRKACLSSNTSKP